MTTTAAPTPIPRPAYRYWTPAEDALVRSLPPQAAARAIGRPLKAIYARRLTIGLIGPRGGRKWTAAEDRVVLRFRPPEALKRLPHLTIALILRRRRVLLRRAPGGSKKRKKSYIRLSPELERYIRNRAGKETAQELARRLGLSRQTIYNVARGSTKANGTYPFRGRTATSV
ncbi:MAG TPA: HTH domain-containing protein [Gemmataceae bacterium]|nr:HTH domain-containing protein [Gemmataceae bacterium]